MWMNPLEADTRNDRDSFFIFELVARQPCIHMTSRASAYDRNVYFFLLRILLFPLCVCTRHLGLFVSISYVRVHMRMCVSVVCSFVTNFFSPFANHAPISVWWMMVMMGFGMWKNKHRNNKNKPQNKKKKTKLWVLLGFMRSISLSLLCLLGHIINWDYSHLYV